MAKPDLRMVVLAISPTYAAELVSYLSHLDRDDLEPEFAKVANAVAREITDQLDGMPSAEEFAEGVRNRPGALSSEADEAEAVHIQTAAEKVAAKMAEAALAAAEGTSEPGAPGNDEPNERHDYEA